MGIRTALHTGRKTAQDLLPPYFEFCTWAPGQPCPLLTRLQAAAPPSALPQQKMAYRARGRRSLASRVAGGLSVPRHSFTATPLPVTATVSITNKSNLTTTSSAQIEPRRSSGSISLEDLFQQIRANTDMVYT